MTNIVDVVVLKKVCNCVENSTTIIPMITPKIMAFLNILDIKFKKIEPSNSTENFAVTN